MTARKPTRRGGKPKHWEDVPPKDRAHLIAQLNIATKWAGGWLSDVPHFRLAIAHLRKPLAAKQPPKVSQRVLDHFKDWTPEMVRQFNAFRDVPVRIRGAEVKLGKSAAKRPPRGTTHQTKVTQAKRGRER